MITRSALQLRRRAWATGCLLAAALAVASSRGPTEYLDEHTGATVTVVRDPLVFAQERSARARSYVTLAAAAVDQSGHLSCVLIGYIWSVGLALDPKDAQGAAEAVTLQADDRRVDLTLQKLSAREFGIGVPVHRPPVGSATPYIYVTDLATLQLLAESSHLSLSIQQQNVAANYQLFADGRSSLKEFVRFAQARF